MGVKKCTTEEIQCILVLLCVSVAPWLEIKLEAAIGFEPMNEGFADLCLSHLATPPAERKV